MCVCVSEGLFSPNVLLTCTPTSTSPLSTSRRHRIRSVLLQVSACSRRRFPAAACRQIREVQPQHLDDFKVFKDQRASVTVHTHTLFQGCPAFWAVETEAEQGGVAQPTRGWSSAWSCVHSSAGFCVPSLYPSHNMKEQSRTGSDRMRATGPASSYPARARSLSHSASQLVPTGAKVHFGNEKKNQKDFLQWKLILV